jgi:phosphoribosylaminoimidazolecarboxamide formyltransferase/IMP cyclohydrolase
MPLLALLSVSDKRGLVPFAAGLLELGFAILSTGGTLKTLEAAGLSARKVSEHTGSPEILGGRVKTLHPRIHGGLLGRPDLPADRVEMEAGGITPISVVAVNLYPFRQTVASGAAEAEVIENIDIGGPTMIRAAAKNFLFSAVVVEPESYDAILQELNESDGHLSLATRRSLAVEAFGATARYDSAIARWFAEMLDDFPPVIMGAYEKVTDLAYGENPHQRAAYYQQVGSRMHVLSQVRQLGGRELSFNNVLDLNSARLLVQEFELPACAIIKHNNPCGTAAAGSAVEAYERAFACDPLSAFGGIVGLNRPLDADTARALAGTFIEAVVAPSLADAPAVLEILKGKPNLRVVTAGFDGLEHERDARTILGGWLVQARDRVTEAAASWPGDAAPRVVTRRAPSPEEWQALRFAWRICAHVKSNTILFTSADRTLAIGAGQMSRVDSVHLAVRKSGDRHEGSVLASDAFFPFRDNVDEAAKAGVTAIAQPGGSVRDADSIAACDEHALAMVFTSMRHFLH